MNKVELGSILQMQSKTLDAIDRLAERLDRIEAAMLKREDLSVSVLKPLSIEEWETAMAGEAVQAGEQAQEGGE